MGGKREEIRKGPWKAEEDQVLLNHVSKYGPRDWSSIRAKGLLQRTGKSCRLRWVNKLRPNLKNGCKFSAEEERIVIELQAQFGNKWARIATYLPGRTDNDVKNFWSSRQKRLARILHNSASSNSKSQRSNTRKGGSLPQDILPCLEVPSIISDREEGPSSKPIWDSSTISSVHEPMEMIPLDLTQPVSYPFDQTGRSEPFLSQSQNAFSLLPDPQNSISFPFESQELLATLDDPNFFNILEPMDSAGLKHDVPFTLPDCFFQLPRGCHDEMKDAPDDFLDDFPGDLFDQTETLPDSED